MRHGIVAPNIGSYSSPANVVELAKAAEAARWQALLLWDHLGYVWDAPTGDPWLLLAVAGASSRNLLLGTAVTPLARYRPHRLASTISTLTQITGDRFVLGVGLGGVPGEFEAFGEPSDRVTRAKKLDEALQLMTRLWSGTEISYEGRYYKAEGVTLSPVPDRVPPIWVGGNSIGALRRAARHEGWIADSTDALETTMEPDEIRSHLKVIREARHSDGPFDVAVMGYSHPEDHALISRYRTAGGTWWLESIHDLRGSFEEMMRRVEAGPVR